MLYNNFALLDTSIVLWYPTFQNNPKQRYENVRLTAFWQWNKWRTSCNIIYFWSRDKYRKHQYFKKYRYHLLTCEYRKYQYFGSGIGHHQKIGMLWIMNQSPQKQWNFATLHGSCIAKCKLRKILWNVFNVHPTWRLCVWWNMQTTFKQGT